MTTAVIGATGRVGNEVGRGVLARGDPVTALVRDPGSGATAELLITREWAILAGENVYTTGAFNWSDAGTDPGWVRTRALTGASSPRRRQPEGS